MKENNYKVIYANSLEELQLKSLGCHHDHAHHIGKSENLPEKLKNKDNGSLYIFIYYEDEPIKKIIK